MSLAVVVIAHERRRETTFPRVLESVLREQPNEIVVVGDFPVEATGVRSFIVPPITRTTIDALVKRDVGHLVTHSEHICYLSDDHALAEGFMDAYRLWSTVPDILVPSRFCWQPVPWPSKMKTWLEVGKREGYAAGHCAIYKRWCGHALPWAASYHHPNWDVLHTRHLEKLGAHMAFADHDLAIEDLEPEARPWEMTEQQRMLHNRWHQSIAGDAV
jgi:hypothetical protein